MNIKKLIAGVLSFCVVAGAVPVSAVKFVKFVDNSIVANAEESGFLTYQKYDDHIAITDCQDTAIKVDIPAEIDGLPVTEIGSDNVLKSGAFAGCSNLKLVTIPDSVTRIGDHAFEGCSSLTDITIPNSVEYIGYDAFLGCSSLTDVKIPDSVTEINIAAFYGCSSLTTVNIPYGITSISGYTFNGCKNLTEIIIPNGVTYIGGFAFNYCSNLTEIIIPENVTYIGESAFYNCSNITNITIPDSVTEIGKSAFSGCSSLTEITFLNPYTEFDSLGIGINKNAVIKGYEYSTAQGYAEKYGYTFESLGKIPEKPAVVLGDVNGDNLIDASDASQILAIYSVQSTGGTPVESAEQLLSADVNGDGLTDASDASTILAYYAYVSTGGTDNIETFMANNV